VKKITPLALVEMWYFYEYLKFSSRK